MKKLLLALLASTAVLFSCHMPVAAGFISGEKIMELIANDKQNIAVGYILGAFDSQNGRQYCLPKEVTQGQVVNVMLAVLINMDEEQLKAPMEIIVYRAFHDTFKCPVDWKNES